MMSCRLMDVLLCHTAMASTIDKWNRVFHSLAEAQHAAGLRLIHLWRCVDEPNNVFFLVERSHALGG